MSRPGSRNRAHIVAVIGATGSGKGRWMKAELAKVRPSRMLVWDPMDEYTGGKVFTDVRKLAAACVAAGTGPFVGIFRPGDDQDTYRDKFAAFCTIAFAWTHCDVIVDELADVTTASLAPGPWRRILTKGRHKALRVWACAQRPALIDKTIFSQATLIHCSRLNFLADIRTMAGVLGVTVEEVRDLKADEDTDTFEFIERLMGKGITTRGTLPSVKKPRPAKKIPKTSPEPKPDA